MQFQFIASDPDILNGKPRIVGTRISVELILDWLAAGSSIDDIVREFPHLSVDAVREAIRYAAELSRNELVLHVRLAS